MNPAADVGTNQYALLGKLLAIDPRALGAFRIGAGVLLALDLVSRFPLIDLLYTDTGTLPRRMIVRATGSPAFWGGSLGFEQLLFAVLILAAVALALGVVTRFATFVCWLGLLSIIARHPGVGNAGDLILVQLLFWGIFLPLDARWALRAASRGESVPPGGRVLSLAGVGLVLTMPLVYFSSVFHKLAGVGWTEGTVVFYTISRENWATPFGRFLVSELPFALAPLTWGTLALEFLGPLLLFSPIATPQLRIAVILGFLGLQAGMGLSIDLWLFPFVSSLALVPLVPSTTWNRIAQRARGHLGLPEPASDILVDGMPEPSQLRRPARAIAGVALMLVGYSHLEHQFSGIETNAVGRAARNIGLNQGWIMYSSERPWDERLLIRGETDEGTQIWIDDWGEHARWEPFRRLRESYRGRRSLIRLEYRHRPRELESFAGWVCSEWSGNRNVRLKQVHLVSWRRSIERDGSAPTLTRKLLASRGCEPPT